MKAAILDFRLLIPNSRSVQLTHKDSLLGEQWRKRHVCVGSCCTCVTFDCMNVVSMTLVRAEALALLSLLGEAEEQLPCY